MARLLFVGSFGLLVYSYCIYPLLLLCLLRRRQAYEGGGETEKWPFVSMVLAAYNEEKVIVEKIRNFLDCGYPGPMEMVIVSDCSSDRTAELVRSCDDPRVHLIAQQRRAGKGAAVNQAIAAARGEILIFSDANSLFAPNTLIELVRLFADQRVGLVTGCTRYTKGTIGSLYQRYEQALKSLESRGGVVATADGAIYAMRRTLWRRYDPKLTNDFLHPILVSLEGADAIVAPKAVCDEEFSIDNEFARQVRMVSLASLVYLAMLPKLLLAGRWRSILVLTSHKLLRWLTVPLLALLAAASLWLAPGGGIYLLAALAEGAFALAVVAGALGRKLGTSERLTIPFQFVALNCAGALGLWRCLAGSVPVVWQPRKD